MNSSPRTPGSRLHQNKHSNKLLTVGLLLSVICGVLLVGCASPIVVTQPPPKYERLPEDLRKLPPNMDMVPDSDRPLRFQSKKLTNG